MCRVERSNNHELIMDTKMTTCSKITHFIFALMSHQGGTSAVPESHLIGWNASIVSWSAALKWTLTLNEILTVTLHTVEMCSLWLLCRCSGLLPQTGPKWSSRLDAIYFMKITITTESCGRRQREVHANGTAMKEDRRPNQAVITHRIITTESH